MSKKTHKSDIDWQAELSEQQFKVCRLGATEPAFSGQYYHCSDEGSYHCLCCDARLFSSEDKYDSGSGWPSYLKPIDNDAVCFIEDESHGMQRVEVKCNACDAHLGHVFADGPAPTGKRFCINSCALKLKPNQ